jgi:hypothetical protein
MTIRIGGPGVNLPTPASDYPGQASFNGLVSGPHSTNFFDLAPGATYNIPPGDWSLYIGQTCTLQIFDPLLLIWRAYGTTQLRSQDIRSDGTNWRVANLTGCAIGAEITNAGSAYTSVPTVTASAGGSTWNAIVGGAISTTVTVGTAGSGYTVPPLVIFQGPPVGGVPATGYATLSGGTVSGITVTTQGAGYTTAPLVGIFPSPQDPNLGNIVTAKATTTLTGSGTVTAILCSFHGTAQSTPATPPTLTIAGGGGSSAAATAIMCMTISAVTVTGGGTGYVTSGTVGAISSGGVSAASAIYRNAYIGNSLLDPPVPAAATFTTSGGVIQSSGIVIQNSGLFTATPILSALGAASSAATLTPTMGSGHGVFYLQPL